ESVFWRYLVVHSTQLARQRSQTRERDITKERKNLSKILEKAGEIPFACKADAEKMAKTISDVAKAQFHMLGFVVQTREIPLRKPRGRQPKNTQPQLETRFFLQETVTEIPRSIFSYDPEGMFVLLTTIPDRRELSDMQVLEAYKGQQVVEIGFNWLKGPLAVAPVFLKLPSRIDVLGFVYLVSMFVYALVQRDLRREIKKRGVRIVDPCQQRTANPTARALFKLFEGVDRLVVKHESQTYAQVRFLNPNLLEIIEIMNWSHLYFFENPRGCT
ncbi:MAG: IS1634 family transposase, partial [Candidatus Riflebacteria bacterium]|nr:IS1634 family transposase [Candidatus Riflebacteria bacterium]